MYVCVCIYEVCQERNSTLKIEKYITNLISN